VAQVFELRPVLPVDGGNPQRFAAAIGLCFISGRAAKRSQPLQGYAP
jgi:hypothetical protein